MFLVFNFNGRGRACIREDEASTKMQGGVPGVATRWRGWALDVTEVPAAALGLRGFFAGGDSIMHAAEPLPAVPAAAPDAGYGPAPGPDVADAAAPGVQDGVGGLQVRATAGGALWRAVRPRADAFVVNIGDTFAALTDGRHASCLHRAVDACACSAWPCWSCDAQRANIIPCGSRRKDRLMTLMDSFDGCFTYSILYMLLVNISIQAEDCKI